MTTNIRSFCAAFLFGTAFIAPASAVILFEDFDGGAVNSTVNYTGAASTLLYPAPNNNAAQLSAIIGSQNNSIAFDTVSIPSTSTLVLTFDFRLTDDAANAGAGGCCGEAADGIGVGLFGTVSYGLTGGINPGSMGLGDWERPAFPDALTVGFDIFDGGGPNGNVVTLNFADVEIAVTPTPGFILNNNLWHRGILTATDAGPDAQISLVVIEDVNGAAINHPLFSGITVAGVDLNAPGGLGDAYRVIGGVRTGGAFTEGSLDNVMLDVPEPSAAILGAIGVTGLLQRRRRK